ncbi:MAG: hypothetical protein KIT16_19525 [Rhodospirillaceae bacterium]|nr:hypothetical protein [Rhodospirillaceae bacterium]
MTNTILAIAAALAVAAAFGNAAGAQSAEEATRQAEALDRALGAAADPPRAPAVAAPDIGWPQATLPPWLAGQPYRQQPLLTGVPRGGTVGGHRRAGGP